jgi:hypothetical protein
MILQAVVCSAAQTGAVQRVTLELQPAMNTTGRISSLTEPVVALGPMMVSS